MRRILLFTNFTPTADNYNGPSALMYHLLKARPSDSDLLIYTTNINQLSFDSIKASAKALNATIRYPKKTVYNFFHKRFAFADLRISLGIDHFYGHSNYRLSKKDLKEIKVYNPDVVFLFDEAYVTAAQQLSCYNLVIVGYDCFPLFYNRLLRDSYSFSEKGDYRKLLFNYKVAIHRELALCNVACKYFDVGIADRNMFETIAGRKDAKFYPHPHYNVLPRYIDFKKDRLSIVISGKMDRYTYSHSLRMFNALESDTTLASKYKITFLGKTWNSVSNQLKAIGYDVMNIPWVDVYAEELVKHDIQLFPISVGSGTKGKVLDAMSMGLLSIGSEVALENIYVKSGHSSLQYEQPEDVPHLLHKIYSNKQLAAKIAENGRQQVLKWHSPERIFNIIMNDMLNDGQYDGVAEHDSVVNNLNILL